MKILIRNKNQGKWELVPASPYVTETELHIILAKEPSLISIEEVRETADVLAIAVREFSVDTGSIDILGFTANGDIAIIECKLANNQDIKRQVIGQVLDYGANLCGMEYKTLDDKVVRKSGKNLVELVREAVQDPNWDEETFRYNVRSALEKGNFILIIVVDEINDDLTRIIRFINNSGKPAFSLAALEMQRFSHGQSEMLVPHVFGTVSPSKSRENMDLRNKWDEATFFIDLSKKHPESADTAKKILSWALDHNEISRVSWGEGAANGSFVPVLEAGGRSHQLFAIYTSGIFETYFSFMKYKPPFDNDEKRKVLLDRLNQINGVNLPEEAINKRPGIPLSIFNDSESLQHLLETYDWVIEEIINYQQI